MVAGTSRREVHGQARARTQAPHPVQIRPRLHLEAKGQGGRKAIQGRGDHRRGERYQGTWAPRLEVGPSQ